MIQGTVAIVNRGWIATPTVDWLWSLDRRAYHLATPIGGEVVRGRNRGVSDVKGGWVLFVDSDCVPGADAIDRLLAADLPIVGGVILERTGELDVCVTKTFEPTVRYGLAELPSTGVLPVLALGTGCVLIRRYVLDRVPTPWFRAGQLVSDAITEDTEFCLRAAECGFPTYLDLSVRVGHVVRPLLWPHEDGEFWVQWEGNPYREAMEIAVL